MGTTQGLKYLEISTMKLQLFVLSVIILSTLKETDGCIGMEGGGKAHRSIEEIKVPADRTDWNAAIEDLVDRIDRAVPELGIKQNGFQHFYTIAKNSFDV